MISCEEEKRVNDRKEMLGVLKEFCKMWTIKSGDLQLKSKRLEA